MKTLIKKSIPLALAFAIVLSLSCCGGGDKDIILPDIVFVRAHHYPSEEEYVTGKFIGTAGYYVDKNGVIFYFEFEDEAKLIFEEKQVTIEEYADLRNIKELNKRIAEIGVATELEPVPKKDLINYYKSLSKIKKGTALELEKSITCIYSGTNYLYGVRINDNNEEEYILICEDGDFYYHNNKRSARNLYGYLRDIMPSLFAYQRKDLPTYLEDELKNKIDGGTYNEKDS